MVNKLVVYNNENIAYFEDLYYDTYTGSEVPISSLGNNGDYYFQTGGETELIYKKINGTWTIQNSGGTGVGGITGPQGIQGVTGISGSNGVAGIQGETGIPGPLVPLSGILNDSTIPGTSSADALNSLKSVIRHTNDFYVDGTKGDDILAAAGYGPFKTIQACLNYIGQPTTMADALRHISIHLTDSMTALVGNNGGTNQSWDGVYKENLVVPSRMITMYGAGIKIGNNVYNVDTGYGNILKEYSSSRRFGATSNDLRPCLTLVGLMNCKDTHNRLRNGLHIGGDCRTSILKRTFDSIQGDGNNKVTVHITAGQNPYVISVNPNYPTEPLIRIAISGTTNYNATYDITAKINDTTFEATMVSGTNANIGIETSGSFFESDSAGASGLTHDAAFVNCYMQGSYTCDDGTVNSAAPTAGTEVFYANNTRFYTGIEGRTIQAQRWDNCLIAGAMYVNAVQGIANSSFAGTFRTSTFVYSTDDMGFFNNKFNSAVTFTVASAGQTVRMDSMTYTSFLAAGCTWFTNTPTIYLLDDATGLGYTAVGSNWTAPAPATVKLALDRMAALLKILNGGNTIP